MTGKHILLLFAAAIFAGWFLPDAPSSGTFSVQSEQKASKAVPAGTVLESTVRDEDIRFGKAKGAVLERQMDGHFYADAAVNGSDVHFLVDTGASAIALTGDDARSLGLQWNDNDLMPIGRGASGTVMGVPVTLSSVELGGIRAQSVQGAIIPEGLDVSLLGQSFLSKAESIKINDNKMELN